MFPIKRFSSQMKTNWTHNIEISNATTQINSTTQLTQDTNQPINDTKFPKIRIDLSIFPNSSRTLREKLIVSVGPLVVLCDHPISSSPMLLSKRFPVLTKIEVSGAVLMWWKTLFHTLQVGTGGLTFLMWLGVFLWASQSQAFSNSSRRAYAA